MKLPRTLRKWLFMPFAWKYVAMPGSSCRYDLSRQSETESEFERNLRAHVETLAVKIGERNKGVPKQLELAREYIGEHLSKSGRSVERHDFADGANLIAGSGDIVVGAHFDTVPGSPGANDNATGVAIMLELARVLDFDRVRFVGFDNEEHVGQPATEMGSHVYAQRCAERGDRITGMWSLETLGCFCEDAHSQRYPEPFDLFYPTTGNFVAFVGNDASREWVRRSVGAFRSSRAFPSEGVASPGKFADINRSDQWGFWQAGYSALMLTDTANFRYKPYHTPDDTIEKLNFAAMARLVSVLTETLRKVST